MSQFTLTLEEDAIITDALKAKATQYAAMFGVADPALEALIAKLEGYNPVVESAPVVEEVVEEVAETPEEVVAEDAADEDEAE